MNHISELSRLHRENHTFRARDVRVVTRHIDTELLCLITVGFSPIGRHNVVLCDQTGRENP